MTDVLVTGVDACRDGWAAVSLELTGSPGPPSSPARVQVAGTLAEALAGTAAGQVTGIDMPLGLAAAGWRHADREARAHLGPRRSSIYAIPPAPVWEQPSYAAASQVCRALTGQAFSIQAWGLRRKLREANEFRQVTPLALYEVHPELSFRAMAGEPLAEPKSTPAGHELRRRLLAAAGIRIPADAAPRRTAVDVLDAAAVAWTAARIATGIAGVIPDPPQLNESGQEMSIRY